MWRYIISARAYGPKPCFAFEFLKTSPCFLPRILGLYCGPLRYSTQPPFGRDAVSPMACTPQHARNKIEPRPARPRGAGCPCHPRKHARACRPPARSSTPIGPPTQAPSVSHRPREAQAPTRHPPRSTRGRRRIGFAATTRQRCPPAAPSASKTLRAKKSHVMRPCRSPRLSTRWPAFTQQAFSAQAPSAHRAARCPRRANRRT